MEEEVGVFWGWKVLIVVSFITFRYINFIRQKSHSAFGRLCTPIGWKFGFKKLVAYIQIVIYQKWLSRKPKNDTSIFLPSEEDMYREQRKDKDEFTACDMQRIQCLDTAGNNLVLGIIFHKEMRECVVSLRLADGTLYELPDGPRTVVEAADDDNCWAACGLKIDITEAKKRLRIQFNGLMKKSFPGNSTSSLHYVQMKFVWNAEGDWIDVRKDWHSSLMSDAIARETWKENEWKHLIKDQGRGYDQWGVARGLVTVDVDSPIDLNLVSLRQRRWGGAEADTLQCRAGLVGVTDSGVVFYIRASCSPVGLTYARFGHVRFPNGTHCAVSDCELLVGEMSSMPSSVAKFTLFSLTADGRFMDGNMTKLYSSSVEGHRFSSRLLSVQLGLNGERGHGIAELWYKNDDVVYDPSSFPAVKLPKAIVNSEVSQKGRLALRISDSDAQNERLTGGKGSSLSMLTANSSTLFSVPKGFCLTVEALEKHLELNPLIKNELVVLAGLDTDEITRRCKQIKKLIETVPLCTAVMKVLEEQLDVLKFPVAVRSSAVGEDGESTSSAGQNSTFLGLHTFDHVVSGVLKCWASLYSVESVQYRIEHGMSVVCQMAVVVQEMVDAEKAGVLFTAHPLTLDPRRSIISANFGLGETVVSGAVDPDTVELVRNDSGNYTIVSEVPGHKDHKVVLIEDGTKEVLLTDKEALELCLIIPEIMKLAEVGSTLAKIYGKPLDLEWAIAGEELYLLQARPITSQSGWTDFELLHEFDTPVFSDMDLSSIANVGEVFPGATSTLSLTTTVTILSSGPQAVCSISHHRCFLDLYNTTLRVLPSSVDFNIRITDLAVMGHDATTPEVFATALRRNGPTGTVDKLKTIGSSLISMWTSKKLVTRAEELARSAESSGLGSSIEEIFDKITEKLKVLQKILIECHCNTSRASSTSQVILFSILTGGEDITPQNVFDIGTILSSCSKSVSSEIPVALERLANVIASSADAHEFVDLPPLKAIKLLKDLNETAAELWNVFIKKFGHRGWREFDYVTSVWALEPTPVIITLQELVKNKLERGVDEYIHSNDVKVDPSALSVDEIIASLKTPLKTVQRYFLRKFIGLVHATVNHREKTKEAIISTVHQLRLSYSHLARKMMDENKLSRHSLIFHLSHSELRDLIQGNNASGLLIKASQRQRLQKTWDRLQFPHIMTGVPRPVEDKVFVRTGGEGVVKLVGTSVYPGCVVGRALVAVDVDGAREAKPGDVLVTHSTDVGWSPLFPLLGGVVTELGGLISHGAVVAREYGLPCIVGVQTATSTFTTGDMVMLNASAGVIEKIS